MKVLQRVWAASGGQCGKYLAASMSIQLDGLERHGELVDGVDRYCPAVRKELLAMSAASIDRYLMPAKATDQIRGVATTKPSVLLRSSIKVPKSGDEVESEPGFFEGEGSPRTRVFSGGASDQTVAFFSVQAAAGRNRNNKKNAFPSSKESRTSTTRRAAHDLRT